MRWINKENGYGVGVTHLPNYKRASLVVIKGNTETVVGSISNKEMFEEYMHNMLEAVTDKERE